MLVCLLFHLRCSEPGTPLGTMGCSLWARRAGGTMTENAAGPILVYGAMLLVIGLLVLISLLAVQNV
jgi:hypothetical protein